MYTGYQINAVLVKRITTYHCSIHIYTDKLDGLWAEITRILSKEPHDLSGSQLTLSLMDINSNESHCMTLGRSQPVGEHRLVANPTQCKMYMYVLKQDYACMCTCLPLPTGHLCLSFSPYGVLAHVMSHWRSFSSRQPAKSAVQGLNYSTKLAQFNNFYQIKEEISVECAWTCSVNIKFYLQNLGKDWAIYSVLGKHSLLCKQPCKHPCGPKSQVILSAHGDTMVIIRGQTLEENMWILELYNIALFNWPGGAWQAVEFWVGL